MNRILLRSNYVPGIVTGILHVLSHYYPPLILQISTLNIKKLG